MAKYDVVVVGAGNAGLSAAIQSAMAGKKTLLIEQHNLPGGCASSFRRGRFEIEPSLHELCDVGPTSNPGDVRNIFDAYGLNIEWNEVGDCFRIVSTYSDGSPMDVTMPAGIDAFIDKMEEYVPGSRPAMKDLFDLFQEVLDGIAYITASAGHADSAVLKAKYPNMLKTGSYPTSKVFKALKLPKKAQDILSTYWSYLGVDMDHLAFIHYAAMVHKYVSRGAYIPTHTSHEISVKMIERFRELGGEVWFNCRANDFIFDGNRCCGVNTNLGRIDCDYVLANINPDIIYGKMMDKSLIPEREKKLSAARNKVFGARMITAYFGLNKTAEELGIKDYSIFMSGTADSVKEYKNILKGSDTNEYAIFLCYNVANPKASPEGTSLVSFTTFASPEEWSNLSEEEYVALKNKFARKFVKMVKEKAGIDIEPYIEEMSVASPWTFARYLNVPEGSVYGYETRDWDGMMARMMMLSADYPIKGLRPIGTSGPRGDGYSATYICGQLIAKLAIKDLNEGGTK